MTRVLLALVLAVVAAEPALAQDMPLSEILIAGEGWRKVDRPVPRTAAGPVLAKSPDGSTTFRWVRSSGAYIDARQSGAPESPPYTAYAPVRQKRGAPVTAVTGLTTDRAGRIYAATEIGVQVFDPTGRMCGVLTPAAPGKTGPLAFEGDTLTIWIGDAKYARKLRTMGVK